MHLFETNVLLDLLGRDPLWTPWSHSQFVSAQAGGKIVINPIICSELTGAFATRADLDQWLSPRFFHLAPLPYDACWLAGQAFLKYRKAGGTKATTLPDFFIGAHAECAGLKTLQHISR